MTHLKDAQFLVPVIFCMFGFIMAYFIKRGLNIILFAVFLYAALKGLEQLKKGIPDWNNFDRFVSLLQQLGKTILLLTNNMLATAGATSIALFLCGGIAGLVLSRRGV